MQNEDDIKKVTLGGAYEDVSTRSKAKNSDERIIPDSE